ncbi:TetR/AcrR family transcriptional regulator [Actinoplanes sp. NBRC 103695]|uniref:TetR/AcrR family transcriptional regulator n=1 Tax=Actinoplanes sp. NBRC 103695 TaxID=3032202 RepID=UPI0024A191C7|nr:TetR/AcrR family transcriptional regulator [Actinoplanes sp. NBRC 103695]GLY98889.1 TetR family transcriptional regulator [Actinoplanes sp. NBRC 103695]
MVSETASPRRTELLEAAYGYALAHGLADLSLRPLAAAIGSSPRVLLYLFGSKEGLIRELLARARADEVALLRSAPAGGLAETTLMIWGWLSDPAHRALLTLWTEAYARSLIDPDGPWSAFAAETVRDWLALLAAAQPESIRDTPAAEAARTAALALLRGALLDLLATGDHARTTAAVHAALPPG